MTTSLEEALSDFEKSEKTVRIKKCYSHCSDFETELYYAKKVLVLTNLRLSDKRQFDFTDDYLVSEISDILGSSYIPLFEKTDENVDKDDFYFVYLERGLGLDPRYIIRNYKKKLKNKGKGIYRTELTRNAGISLFSEIFLGEQNKIEKIRLYQLNDKKFENFGKNKYDFYLEANF
ncbi:MAG: hypothetical protein BJBARM5_0409 [Candidatus Parvarchaeum acidophilus ARMAN-5]|uniref:Uncharacterized protein n=1 Tax=Candidatus Parvarchaeum acidophilus ARMAN-5 TaxID=662762 RepID=D6GV98_PARA5|nr:MAG: hypothetical protein BJBARM5_0409 [Candidatus Parvarchaeum acidophilus ARMAN-5]